MNSKATAETLLPIQSATLNAAFQPPMDNNSGYMTPSKLTGEKSPDYGGKVMIGGQMYWVSGWKTAKDGTEYISLRFKKNSTYHAEKQYKNRREAEF